MKQKKWLAIFLAMLLLFSLAACSSTNNPEQAQGPGQDPGQDPGQNSGQNQEQVEVYVLTSRTSGSGESIQKCEWNEKGYRIKSINFLNGYEYGRVEYECDKNGYPSKRTDTNGGNDTYEYDSKGNLIKETIYFRDNQDAGRGMEYEYDAAGKLLKETTFSFSEEQGLEPYFFYVSAYEYEYDSAGKLIKINFISDVSNGKSTSYWDYAYDEKGNLIIETTYDGDQLQESTEYEYDSNGKLIRSEYYSRYGGDFVKEYQYDDQGNLVLERHNGVYGETTLAYEYDGMPYPVKVTVVDDGNTEIEILEYQKITVSVARAEEILEVSKEYRSLTTPVLVIIAD